MIRENTQAFQKILGSIESSCAEIIDLEGEEEFIAAFNNRFLHYRSNLVFAGIETHLRLQRTNCLATALTVASWAEKHNRVIGLPVFFVEISDVYGLHVTAVPYVDKETVKAQETLRTSFITKGTIPLKCFEYSMSYKLRVTDFHTRSGKYPRIIIAGENELLAFVKSQI